MHNVESASMTVIESSDLSLEAGFTIVQLSILDCFDSFIHKMPTIYHVL